MEEAEFLVFLTCEHQLSGFAIALPAAGVPFVARFGIEYPLTMAAYALLASAKQGSKPHIRCGQGFITQQIMLP
jgi:hypothetical protein